MHTAAPDCMDRATAGSTPHTTMSRYQHKSSWATPACLQSACNSNLERQTAGSNMMYVARPQVSPPPPAALSAAGALLQWEAPGSPCDDAGRCRPQSAAPSASGSATLWPSRPASTCAPLSARTRTAVYRRPQCYCTHDGAHPNHWCCVWSHKRALEKLSTARCECLWACHVAMRWW